VSTHSWPKGRGTALRSLTVKVQILPSAQGS
jgi:hypothetical protein